MHEVWLKYVLSMCEVWSKYGFSVGLRLFVADFYDHYDIREKF